MPKACKNAMARWAFTAWPDEEEELEKFVENLKKTIKVHAKRWVFQLEECPTTQKVHAQGRVSLKTKTRTPEKLMKCHFSIESNEEMSEFYSVKEETRLDNPSSGPFSDKDKIRYVPPHWQVTELNTVQEEIMEAIEAQTPRQILFVYDPSGGVGKTTLSMSMATTGRAIRLPPIFENARDIMRCAYDMCSKNHGNLFFVDMPRAATKKWGTWCTILEELKNGALFDDRYNFKFRYIDPPKLVVFSNGLPPMGLLTEDRYVVMDLTKEEDLPQQTPEEIFGLS